MDPRPPQHPYSSRPPPERALIHNPNHQPPTQGSQHPPYANYAPASYPPASHAQPQLPMAYPAEPYPPSRRDPFVPSAAHHARRSSYGIRPGGGELPPGGPEERHGAWGNTAGVQGAQGPQHHASHPHSHSGPPPPPSMTSSHPSQGPPHYAYEPPRRHSGGGASPPNHPYGTNGPHAPSHDAPPPSSPQQPHNPATQSQRPSFGPVYGGTRELPGLTSGHRPGSSMSISSIIGGGGDTGASNQASHTQSSPPSGPTNAPTSGHHSSMQPPSPRRGLLPGARPDVQHFRRQPSPDRHLYANASSRPAENSSFSAASPTRSYNPHGSPEQARPQSHHNVQPFKPMTFQGSRPYASSPNEPHARLPRQPPGGIPPRPSSQPPGPAPHPEQEGRTVYEGFGGRGAMYGNPEERRRTLGETQHSRPNVVELLGGTSQSSSDRDRPVTVQPVAQSVFSPPRDARHQPGPANPPRHVWGHSASEEAPRESTEARREEPPALYRSYGAYPPASHAPAPYAHHVAEDMVRGRSLDHLGNRVVEQYHAPPTSDPQPQGRVKPEQLTRSLSSGGNAYPNRYDQSRRAGEEMHNRALLALGPEANRRTGRASPLPQAVQGAQAQPVSIGKDPSIKSEFGRMFSGLGSGLGSTTPSRQSPMPQGGPESLPPSVDVHDARLQRVNSQNGRKPKRGKDDDGVADNESMDGRGTPSARGSKRNKHSHHHHHHVHPHAHAHAHHHHHHHHKPDEEVPQHMASGGAAPFGGRHPNPAPPAAAHHHHHHAAPHHHHHAPRGPPPAQLPSPKLPLKVHDMQPVLDKAAANPRCHLGSYLYEAKPVQPQPSSQLDDQFGYSSKPRPLPAFDRNPINCIVTCRVPRYYLKPRQRQQIVLQRHLWGAQIYRDDSDPIAAAIHSGWIRGEWDDTVSVNMLDPRITAQNDPSDAEDCLTKRPAAPVTPPADMELHLDLLILPRLEKYEGTVEYGISSRKSTTHNGMSFMIHQLRWVEEGMGSRGQERTAAAMKRRLDASTALLSLTTGGEGVMRAANGVASLQA